MVDLHSSRDHRPARRDPGLPATSGHPPRANQVRRPPAEPADPSLVTLVQEYGVARGTAAKAVRVLVNEQLVRIVPGRGAYVIARH